MQTCMRKALTYFFYHVCVGKFPFDSIGSNGQKEMSITQITSEVQFLLLNLSKKVKCHLFCINLDTGYVYVVLWIPKAFSLPYHHPRVVFTISKKEFLDGHYNLHYVKSEFSLK